jgi:hypothetical protein
MHVFLPLLVYLVIVPVLSLIYFVIFMVSYRIDRYPNITYLNLYHKDEIYYEYLIIEAMDKCSKFIPNLKQFRFFVVVTKRILGNPGIAYGQTPYKFPSIIISDGLSKTKFIKTFIHELFHIHGFGSHKIWKENIISIDGCKYLSLTKFIHAKEYLKTDLISLSEDGHHFKDEDGDLMTPVYGHQKKITLKSLYILKDLGHIINIIETNDRFFYIS